MNRTGLFSKRMKKTVLGLMVSACMLMSSGIAVDMTSFAAEAKDTSSQAMTSGTDNKSDGMPSIQEENVGRVSFYNSEHVSAAFALTDEDNMTVRYGDKVYFYVEPDDGWGISDIRLHMANKNEKGKVSESTDSYEQETSIKYNKDVTGVYYFEMPEYKFVHITFETIKTDMNISDIEKSKKKSANNSYYDYLISHLDSKYVNVPDNLELSHEDAVNAVRVKYTMAVDDGTGQYLDKKIDDFMNDMKYIPNIRGQYEAMPLVFDVDKDSKYYVLFANPMVADSDIVTTDSAFAENNDFGHSLDGYVYDAATGIAYLPKKSVDVKDDKGNSYYAMTQMQFMCVKKSDESEHAININVKGNGSLAGLTKSGKLSYANIGQEFVVDLTSDESLMRQFSTDDIVVTVDGVPVTVNQTEDGESLYFYNNANGTLTIRLTPMTVGYVDVTVSGTEDNSLNSKSKSTLAILADSLFPSTRVKAAKTSISAWYEVDLYNKKDTDVTMKFSKISVGDNMDFAKNKCALYDHAIDNTGAYTAYFTGSAAGYVKAVLEHDPTSSMKDPSKYETAKGEPTGSTQFSIKIKKGAKTTKTYKNDSGKSVPVLKINAPNKWRRFQCICAHIKDAASSMSTNMQVKGVCVYKGSKEKDGITTNYIVNAYTLEKAYGQQSLIGTLAFDEHEGGRDNPYPIDLEIWKYASTKYPNINVAEYSDAEELLDAIYMSDEYYEIESPFYDFTGTVITLTGTDDDGNVLRTLSVPLDATGYAYVGNADLRVGGKADGDIIPHWTATETAHGKNLLNPAYWFVSKDGTYSSYKTGGTGTFNMGSSSDGKTLEVFDYLATTQLTVRKSIKNQAFVNGNANYNKIAQFRVSGPYLSAACNESSWDDMGDGWFAEYVTTDGNGMESQTFHNLPLGYYKIEESLIDTSKGTVVSVPTRVIDRTASGGIDSAYVVTETNDEQRNPLTILLKKVDKYSNTPVGDANLSGIRYKIGVYANETDASFLYSFEAVTKDAGDGTGVINLDKNGGCVDFNSFVGKAANDVYYGNIMNFPIGYVRIKEIRAENTGYRLASAKITSSSNGAKNIGNDTLQIYILDNGGTSVTLNYFKENAQEWGDTPLYGGIKIKKRDFDRLTTTNNLPNEENDNDRPQGDAKFEGIKFKIYNVSENPVYLEGKENVKYPACTVGNLNEASVVATLTCNAKGECQTETNLPYGTYLIKEDTSNMDSNESMGYLADANISAVIQIHPKNDSENHRMYSIDDLIDANAIDITSTLTAAQLAAHKEIFADKIKRGGVVVQKLIKDPEDETAIHNGYTGKKRYDNNVPIPEGDGTLENTEFSIYSISDEDVCIWNNNEGTSRTWKKSYTESKLEAATWKAGSDGKYGYYDGNTKLEPCLTIKTNAAGRAKSIVKALPYGTYIIRESKAPTGARINTKWKEKFTIRVEGKYEDVSNSYSNTVTNNSNDTFTRDKTGFNPVINEPFRGNVMIEKDDKEYGKSEANGGKDHGNNEYGTHLEGIEFTVKNKSKYPVYVDTNDDGKLEEYMPNTDIYKIYTKWDKVRKKYVASTCPYDEAKQTFIENPTKDFEYRLPYGTYGIRETDTTDSYIMEDTAERTFVIRDDKSLVTKYVSGSNTAFADMIFYNSVVRGDFEFEKQVERSEDELATVFVVTNQTTGERHVVVTDRNGEYRSDKDWTRHEYKTNYNDVLLKQIDAGEIIDMSKVVNNYKQSQNGTHMTDTQISQALAEKGDGAFLERCGLWFSLGEDGSTSKPSVIRGVDYREHGALPYGYYTVREVRTSTNSSYDLIDWNVWIYNDNTENNNRVDCGTKENHSPGAPALKSKARDLSTEKNIGMAAEKTVIEDIVTCNSVVTGRKYVVIGKLYDATDDRYVVKSDGTDYTVEKEFTPGYHDSEDSKWDDKDEVITSQDVTQTFKFDARKYAGHKIVVYEMLYEIVDGKRQVVAVHRDKNDEYQTVRYPKISTLNLSDTMKDHDNPTTGKVTLTDTVTYSNLLPNKNYKLTGILMDKDAGDEAMDKDKNYIQANASFFADESDGTATLTYTFDADGFAGKTLVSFVTLNQGGDDLALHADLNDEFQSIHFPDIHTTALDGVTDDHESLAENPVTIIDTVAYENLLPNKTYRLTGVLMNKKTNEKLLDADGNEIVSEVEFVPVDANGSVEVVFTFDGSLLEGETTVAFETLERNGIELTTHADIEDEDQTVRFPKIQTTATYGDDAINEGKAIEETKITDTIYYENLKPGEEYVVSGILMDKNTKTPVVDIKEVESEDENDEDVTASPDATADVTGEATEMPSETEEPAEPVTTKAVEVTAEAKFVPEKSSGYVDVTFTFDATDYAGHDMVVFETLYHNGFKVAVHEDYEDEGQTIHFPKIGTTLTDKNTKLHESTVAEMITLVDTVAYKNLRTDKTYRMTGVLYDKKTGEKLLVDGKEVTSTKEFMPDKSDGVVELEFTFNSMALRGSTVVAFEDLYRDDLNVATHADIEDEDQTVVFPDIKTFAKKTDTEKEKILYVNDKASITDIITYSNVIPGHRYRVTGTLMSKKKQEAVNSTSGAITASAEFVAEAESGSTELIFTFDATNYVDDELVCFDNLYVIDDSNPDDKGDATETLLLEDKDWENKDETITVPKPDVHTSAVNNETKTKQMSLGKKATITDTVTYSKLNPGTSYSLTGTLMNKKTKEPIVNSEGKPITSSVTFIPEQPDGTVDMTFTVDTRQLAGESIVVFENLYLNEIEIATHADIKDKEQTTYVMSVKTKAAAADKRSKVVDLSKNAKIVDTVSYKNLVAGETYIVTGKLMNKATNKAIQKDGVDYTVSKEFVPEKRSGEVDITFTVDTTKLKDATLVVFEDVTTTNGTLIGQHHDINDENQSVVIRTTTKVQTGVRNHAGWMAVLVTVIAGILGGAFLYLRKRRRALLVKSVRK